MSDDKKLWEHEIDGVEDIDDVELEDNELDHEDGHEEAAEEEIVEEIADHSENLGGRRVGGRWGRI
tara:strand:- start:24 stop:221 length:198 start_codon:yes stop_codon:yes gene_type:complete